MRSAHWWALEKSAALKRNIMNIKDCQISKSGFIGLPIYSSTHKNMKADMLRSSLYCFLIELCKGDIGFIVMNIKNIRGEYGHIILDLELDIQSN